MAWLYLTFCLLTAILPTHAIHLQLRGTTGVVSHRRFVSLGPSGLKLNNSEDISYYADIVLGNETFQVLADTGSSDLWVAGNVKNSTDTGLTTSIKYASNSVQGSIKLARLDFAGRTIPDQAFLEVPPDAANADGHGILGLGPPSSSFVSKTLSSSAGAPVLERIFTQDPTSPNFFTLLLGRDQDPTNSFTGSLTVGEVLNDLAGILDEPRLPISGVPENMSDDQHLQILLDPDGISGPDGKPIPIESNVQQTVNKRQATVVLDSGFTLPQLPVSVVDAIYGKFYGAEYAQVPGIGGAWLLPCKQEVNVTFSFSGKIYPIHPLDMSMEPSRVNLSSFRAADGSAGCIGTFQPFTYGRGIDPNYDMVLGMAFMRNVYSLFHYGDSVGESIPSNNSYVQLLSITNAAQAHADFVAVRLGGIDTTGVRGLKNAGGRSNSGQTTMYYVVAIVGAIGILLVLTVVIVVVRRRRRMR